MAILLKATYVKKLGLPQYSSHQYSVEVSAELTDISQVSQASADLYTRLQQAVDAQIVKPGYIPGDSTSAPTTLASLAHNQTQAPTQTDRSTLSSDEDAWRCSDKQRDLILKIVTEHSLDKGEVDALARQRFGKGVRQLNKLEASGLIDELIETHGHAGNGGGHNRHRSQGQGQGGGARRDYQRPAYQGRGRS